MTPIPLGILAGSGSIYIPGGYWMHAFNGATNAYPTFVSDVTLSSTGLAYFSGYWNNSGDVYGGTAFKLNNDGTKAWMQYINPYTSNDGSQKGIASDAANNIFSVGPNASTIYADAQFRGELRKFDSAGTLQWKIVTKDNTTPSQAQFNGVATDPSGNVIIGGYYLQAAGQGYGYLAKYNTSGALVWHRGLADTVTPYTYISNVTTDSSGNVFAVGTVRTIGGAGRTALFSKFDSNGNALWHRYFGNASATSNGYGFGYGIATDSSGNVYVTGYYADNVNGFIVKYDANGNQVWQRTISGTSVNVTMFAVAVASNGNVYATGSYGGSAGYKDNLILKFDSSGNLIWQRKLAGTSGSYAGGGRGIAVDANENIYIAAVAASTNAGGTGALMAKLPPDGSKTGTYTLSSGNVYAYSVATATVSSTSVATGAYTINVTTSPAVTNTSTSSTTNATSGPTSVSLAI